MTRRAGGTLRAAVYAYTAFGEAFWVDGSGVARIGGLPPSSDTRYLYCGQWGYESGLLTLVGVNSTLPTMVLQHVGYRWYEPGIGRFVQRDPIGTGPGEGAYTYTAGNPVAYADPMGLETLGNTMVTVSIHAAMRMTSFSISAADVLSVIATGAAYYDTKWGSLAFWGNGIYAAVSLDSTNLATVFCRSRPLSGSRWVPLP